MTTLRGRILTPGGFVDGELAIAEGRIAAVDGAPADDADVLRGGAPIVLPGFVDLHVHGGGGRDAMEGGDALRQIARTHARHGTTSLLATTMSAPLAEIEAALAAIAPACAERAPGGARVLGVHLEGPFLSPARLGAQPDHCLPATADAVRRLRALAPIRLVTLAPEVSGQPGLIGALVEMGLRVQIGHSDAGYDEAVAALEQGATGFTHLYNAMSALHHRAPGVVGAALAHARYAEIIPDLVHVHPGAIRAALRAIPCLYCVSDATAAAGMPEGEFRLGRQTVRHCLGAVRLADGTLAGSALTMDRALRNLVALGLPLADASRRTSTYAADHLGLADRGRIVAGASADVVVVDAGLQLQRVVVEGEEIAR